MKKKKIIYPDKPLTEDEFRSMKKYYGLDGLAQIIGEEAVAPLRRRGRPKKIDKKVSLHLRVDKEIADTFRAIGKGWQTRMNEVLHQAIEKGMI